jgi:hypothetical protein
MPAEIHLHRVQARPADADPAPPSYYVETFKLLDGGLRDSGWMGEGRPKGGHALAILPGLTHCSLRRLRHYQRWRTLSIEMTAHTCSLMGTCIGGVTSA